MRSDQGLSLNRDKAAGRPPVFFRRPGSENPRAGIFNAENGVLWDKIPALSDCRFCLGQVVGRIDRFAVLTQFEMQFDPVGIAAAHTGYALTAFDDVLVFDQNTLVVAVGG